MHWLRGYAYWVAVRNIEMEHLAFFPGTVLVEEYPSSQSYSDGLRSLRSGKDERAMLHTYFEA